MKDLIPNGFTPAELKAWSSLGEAAKYFNNLEPTHPSQYKDFEEAIHRAQSVLQQRLMQRTHPEIVATYKYDDDSMSDTYRRWLPIPMQKSGLRGRYVQLNSRRRGNPHWGQDME